MFFVRSDSEEGRYYLVKNSRKYKKFWVSYATPVKCGFKTEASAKASLSKLLKIMPEYSSDSFRIVEHEC